MKELAFAAQMRELDRTAIEDRRIPSLNLMEAAAWAAANAVMEQLTVHSTRTEKNVVIFCGPGNNGGDGVAMARLLMEHGVKVKTLLVGNRTKMTPDERAMEEKLLACGGALEDFYSEDSGLTDWLRNCDAVVDAIFGVGLCRTVGGDFCTAIQLINGCGCPVIACDVPSGVSADTGEILGAAVRADVTVTFTCAKPGLFLGEGRSCAGRVVVADIGIPEELVRDQIAEQKPSVRLVDNLNTVLPRRSRTAHKGDFGKVFILAGSEGFTGAPVLASRAAVRSGAGLVFLGVPREIYPIVAVKCDEAMPFPLQEDYETILNKAESCDVALIGPGLGQRPEAKKLALSLLLDLDIPVVLDADGINALKGHIDVLDARHALTVLTPHDGEFQRLTGCELPIRDRLSEAKSFAQAHHCVMILKGHNTITAAPDGSTFINASGNPGMAKGGSGDVLAGLLAGLLGQKQLAGDPVRLCAAGVHFHGLAGDRCADQRGEYGMTPADMVEMLPEVLKDFTEK